MLLMIYLSHSVNNMIVKEKELAAALLFDLTWAVLRLKHYRNIYRAGNGTN